MGRAMIFAASTFFAVAWLAIPQLGDHGLWLAFVSYLAIRSALEHYWGKARLFLPS